MKNKGKQNSTNPTVLPFKKARSYTYKNRVVSISEDKSSDIIKYGKGNDFPQRLIKQIDESGTATSCIDILTQYINAKGLVNVQFGAEKINDTQTTNELVAELSTYVAPFQGVSLYVMRGMDGKVKQLKAAPFEQIRRTDKNTFVVNPTYGNKFDKSKGVEFPAFRGAEISAQELQEHISVWGEDKGEILYFFRKKPGKHIYPIPTYHAGIEDVNTDSELSKYEYECVTNSFLPSGILTIVGNYDDTTKDENGNTQQDYLDNVLEAFTGNAKDSEGASGRQKLLILQAKTKEEAAIYQALANEGILNAAELATPRIANKVARHFGVPPFMIGLGGHVGFATDIINDNIKLFNNRVLILQELITRPLEMCFPGKDFKLTQLNDFAPKENVIQAPNNQI